MELHAVRLPGAPAQGWVLRVKLRDEVQGRVDDQGRLRSEAGLDLAPVQTRIDQAQLRLRPLLALPPQALRALEARAQARSGRAQPDLAGMLEVVGPQPPAGGRPGSGHPQVLLDLARELQALPTVEYAFVAATGAPPPGSWAAPPPGDLGSPTPDYADRQGYLDIDPGIGAWQAWALGVQGAGLRLSDCEYGWQTGHEDLVDRDLHQEVGQTAPSWVADYGWDEHGTAVMGELAAVDNGYGVSGALPGAEIHTFPEYSDEEGSRRPSAIASALADSAPGDVVMLEMQTVARPDGAYGPAELDPDVFTVVQVGVDAGIVVVGAGGNGAENLDSSWYVTNYLAWGDSGAILVGAGSADTRHDKLYFSTYGARINLQGWGVSVVTLGYGDLAAIDGDPLQRYTSAFSGTSSATPIVAAAALLLQDDCQQRFGEPLEPRTLRALLQASGHPQGSGGHIGPLPDLAAAFAALDADDDGYRSAEWGGDDCEDTVAAAHPGAAEVWYDGVDGDCLGGDDNDADGDGFDAASQGGDDCDDGDAAVNPDATELMGDGVDNDCDGSIDGAPPDDSGTADSGTDSGADGGTDGGSDGGTDAGASDTGGGGKDGPCGGCSAGPVSGARLALLAPLLLLRRRRRHRPA